jgi:threonine synthase
VQTENCRPLQRAWVSLRDCVSLALGGTRLVPGRESFAESAAAIAKAPGAPAAIESALREARAHRGEFMQPWESVPHSVAHGILDDETYDWAALAEGMLVTGGWPVAASEDVLREARDLAHAAGVRADATGAASLAGALVLRREGRVRDGERIGVLLTGVERTG